jgi:transposase-like protein
MRDPFRYFNSSPEVIRLVVMMYIRYPLSLRQVEEALSEQNSKYLERPSNRSDRPGKNAGKSMATKSGSDVSAK